MALMANVISNNISLFDGRKVRKGKYGLYRDMMESIVCYTITWNYNSADPRSLTHILSIYIAKLVRIIFQ